MNLDLGGIVAGCYSMPRLAFTDNMFCAVAAGQALNIDFVRHSGLFWGQSLQQLMEQAAESKYILTVDYDTVFHWSSVAELYRLMEANAHADAVQAMQIGRDRNGPLGVPENTELLADELMSMKSGHFGLTMIRTEALHAVPRPWFCAVPSMDGGWGEGHTDEDVYFRRTASASATYNR
jgi:hypothetical protein